MIGRSTPVGRILATVAMVGILTVTAACAMNSPKEQAERERKAASVQVFKLHMTKDLWTRINVGNNNSTKIVGKPKSLTDDPNGMVTIELTGPQLVDYLQSLDYNAHGGLEAKDPSLAAAVYDTLAPVLDKIQTTPAPGAPGPEVTVDANVGPAASDVVAPTTSAGPEIAVR
jgi:hypothetical protein